MRFKHTNRKGFWYGFIDFFTAGLFFLIYMPCVLQDELDAVLGYRTQRYYIAYLLGLPTLTVYTIVWMARIAEELRAKAIELGIEGKPHVRLERVRAAARRPGDRHVSLFRHAQQDRAGTQQTQSGPLNSERSGRAIMKEMSTNREKVET